VANFIEISPISTDIWRHAELLLTDGNGRRQTRQTTGIHNC